MIPLSSKPNVVSPSSTYPYGAIKDNPGDGTGTPVNTLVYGDFHQFFAKLFANSGLTSNGLVDNATNGFQLFEAFITSGNINFVADFITGVLGGYTTNDLIVLWGCSITGTFTPGTANITAGAIFYNNIVYKVPAATVVTGSLETAIFKINTSIQPNTIYLTNGASNSGIANYNSTTIKSIDQFIPKTDGLIKLRTTRINIGDWNMNSTDSVTVAHGLADYTKIRSISVMIIADGTGNVFPLNFDGSTGVPNGTLAGCFYADPININLKRLTSGWFQSTSFDSTSYNRGWITITYEA